MKNIYLIRHGESVANVDERLYRQIPDHRITLTLKGENQATCAGQELNNLMPTNKTVILYSPWQRARHTAELIHAQLYRHSDKDLELKEDPLIHEQSVVTSFSDMSTVDDYHSTDKYRFGEFWFKSGAGESLSDTYNRARLFALELKMFYNHVDNIVVVSHGVFLTMLIGILRNLSIEEILDLDRPNNCQIIHEVI